MTLPTVTTQAVSNIAPTTADANGNITDTGNGYCTKRGFVFSLTSHADPGNIAPALSDYEFSINNNGSFSTGAFFLTLFNLIKDTQYFVRAFAYNSQGYNYGDEVNFTTLLQVYPDSIYSPRTKENRPGIDYEPLKSTVLFAEDISKLDDEVVAVETELGTNPKGLYASVKENLEALWSAISSLVVSFLDLSDTPSSYTDQAGKVVAVTAEEDGLEFITAGGGEKCTGDEINTGTDDNKFATPKAIADSDIAFLSDIKNPAFSSVASNSFSVAINAATVTKIFEITSLDGDSDGIYKLIIVLSSSSGETIKAGLRFNDDNGNNYNTSYTLHLTGTYTITHSADDDVNMFYLVGRNSNEEYVSATVIEVTIKATRSYGGSYRTISTQIGAGYLSAYDKAGVKILGGAWANTANNLISIQLYASRAADGSTIAGKYWLEKIND